MIGLDVEVIPAPPEGPTIKAYKYRFIILLVYGFYSGVNLYQINQFTIIENVIQKYYNTSSYMVSSSQTIFTAMLLLCIGPVVRFIDRTNLMKAALACTVLTVAGAALKCLATKPTPNDFNLIILAQGVCGIAQCFSIMLPPRIVAVWFPAEEQNRACAASLIGGEIGMLVGAIVPIYFVKDKHEIIEVRDAIETMLGINCLLCISAFSIVGCFFRARPKNPPSFQRQQVGEPLTKFKATLKELAGTKEFVLVVTLYGFACGIWSAFGINENMIYLYYFPGALFDLFSITLITSIAGGMVGNLAFGYILDKTLKYKLFTFLLFLCITLSYGVMAICFEMRWHWASYVTIILFGFFSSCSVNISFQYIAEITFPISEVLTGALLQVSLCLVTLGYTYLFNYIIEIKRHIFIHYVAFGSFSLMTACTYFLSSNLKRMLVKQERQD